MSNKTGKDQKGFTMIEAIIVISIIGILAAILIPNFASMSRRARVNADIRGLQQLQNHVQIYYTNYGRYPDADMTVRNLTGTDFQLGGTFANNFIDKEYMHSRYFEADGLRLQTVSAEVIWDYSKKQFLLDTDACDVKTKDIIQEIKDASTLDAYWLK
jgi:prepilin-type N-terminal cleavage/methylation domain-containing protein